MLRRAALLAWALFGASAAQTPAPTPEFSFAPTGTPTCIESEPLICKRKGSGLLLPYSRFAVQYDDEYPARTTGRPSGTHVLWRGGPAMAIFYFVVMIWCFMGVGIIADKFMAAIEVITSAEKEAVLKDGTKVSFKVWNATVANLTLMALGSSAPEIILSVLEICTNEFYSGQLGPSTIVGSAAFNLFIIIGVCIVSLDPGEQKKISNMTVFSITAFFSVFAYFWLIIILVFISPNVCEFWEGLLTFLFFPLLVGLAWGADNGLFETKSGRVRPADHIVQIGGRHFHPGEAAELLRKIEHHGLSEEETTELVAAMQLAERHKPSRAQLRRQVTRQMLGGKRVTAPPPRKDLIDKYYLAQAGSAAPAQVFFGDGDGQVSTKYAVLESAKTVSLHVMRIPATGPLTLKYRTVDVDGGAKAGEDYEGVDCGVVEFLDGECTKDIVINIFDDEQVEEDETFLVRIFESSDPAIDLAAAGQATVTIIDDDEPGEVGLYFQGDVLAPGSAAEVAVKVERHNGASGTITVKYRTVDGDAKSGVDFVGCGGELHFGPNVLEKVVRITLLDTTGDAGRQFRFELFGAVGPVSRAGIAQGRAECGVRIVADESTARILKNAQQLSAAALQQYGTASPWSRQFTEAFVMEADDDELAGVVQLALHWVTVPWKLLFAIVPPEDLCGGWLCFGCALGMIGVVTALIADMAELFGCSVGFPDAFTAITFVALGTSLPDTFASKAAARQDDTADAAVGNVTGSNAVNVFLGLGLPWLLASTYWEFLAGPASVKTWGETFGENGKTPLDNWRDVGVLKKMSHDGGDAKTAVFVVPAGSLGTSVGIFCACAAVCLATLAWRRHKYGAELGGPAGPAKATCYFFVFLWFVYIGGSAVQIFGELEPDDCTSRYGKVAPHHF
ncbi:Sodium/calcium exchanger protein-domain-containing protein [Pelagophyceae sp. CCMP2097]|nr:Sodium/calcium exchanger protein-domain-containing protein [Pelagophyceae sp. CCMP2097]|mmetsp:Transcript_10801/g.35981  ORF Transcript_10801/g.35981 Transcript_10801/m.35981 type:complete len:902 (-) Transcript_10801:141-2846(-)